jgi:hypothetical protein
MHKFFSMILCITLISVLSACGGGGNTNATSTTSGATKGVTFSFSKQGLVPIASSAKSLYAAGVQTTLDPSATHAFLTVTDGSGNPSYHTVDIFSINGNYITATIPLTPGTYTLTQFLVLDSNNNVLYLAPTQSAADDIKQLVSTVLPISFTVTNNVTNNTVALQVLAPDPDTTSDEYGYTSIPFSIVNYIKFMSSVQILNTTTNNWELTTANLTVNGVNYSHPPQASTLHVAQADSYTLVFSKTGYETKTITLTAAEIASYQTAPLVVTLIRDDNHFIESEPGTYTLTFTSDATVNVSYLNGAGGGGAGFDYINMRAENGFNGESSTITYNSNTLATAEGGVGSTENAGSGPDGNATNSINGSNISGGGGSGGMGEFGITGGNGGNVTGGTFDVAAGSTITIVVGRGGDNGGSEAESYGHPSTHGSVSLSWQ